MRLQNTDYYWPNDGSIERSAAARRLHLEPRLLGWIDTAKHTELVPVIMVMTYDNVRAFSTKLVLWKAQLSQTNLCHFPACKALMDVGTPFSGEKYADPFSFDVQDASPVLQIELIDLQCNSELKAKFREVSGKEDKLGQFFRELPPTFPELSRMFKRTMCLFGSTYLVSRVKSSSPPWTLISQSTGPNFLTSSSYTEGLNCFLPQAKCGSAV